MAASILADIKNRNGWSTYKTYFSMYSAWYAARYEAQPPTCELTGLIVLNLNLATDFMRWMGSPGAAKTVGQVLRISQPTMLAARSIHTLSHSLRSISSRHPRASSENFL